MKSNNQPAPAAQEKADAWVMRVPVLGTSHMKEDTAANLADMFMIGQNVYALDVAPYRFGCFLHVPDTDEPPETAEEPIPEDLLAIFAWCRKERIEWVRLDRDGDVIADLPVYDW
jgi:hypothetical protein